MSSEGGVLTYFKDKDWMFILRFLGGSSACVLIVFGLIGVFTLGGLNPKDLVDDVYQVIFGALIIFAELRWVRFLKQFSFLTSFLGLGLFYIFVGGLALDQAWWKIFVALIFITLGLVYVFLFCIRRKIADPNAAPGTANSLQHTDLNGPDHVEEAAKQVIAKQAMKQMFNSNSSKPAAASSSKNFQQFVDEDDAANRA